ncbi:MAG: lytic transglycosylase domain-containing protein [Gaiellaceae bacterium]
MRFLIFIAVAVLGVGATSAWVVKTEPDTYLRARYPLEFEHILRGHASNHALDPALLAAVVYVESRFDSQAESAAGAVGLMQLLPDTAKGIALRTGGERFVVADLRDPEINVRYGSWYLDHLRGRYDDTRLMLAAYHAGQGNVDRWRADGAGIAFPETRGYVADVLRIRDVYADAYPSELGL